MSESTSPNAAPTLTVVMYHYVCDLPRSRFPRLKGLLTDDFRRQVAALQRQFDVVDCATALEFLRGKAVTARPPCLLTFDDGLKDHYTDALPILVEAGASGVFFLTTACQAEGRVAAVHKNHALMAELGPGDYAARFAAAYARRGPWPATAPDVVARTYRWDEPEVATFKYVFNFLLPHDDRDAVLDELFPEVFGDERAFAAAWYLDWREARAMQAAGMTLGGHTHRHAPLTSLGLDERRRDLTTCAGLLREHLSPQPVWPFSYPYGKRDSFDDSVVAMLGELGFDAAFTTEVGNNPVGADLFRLRRIDTKDAPS